MGELFLWILIFVLSLSVLVKASDYFINAAEKIGLSLRLPSFIIGVTLVATGTSLPELISSLVAVYKNSSEIVVGNVIGSNITNICFVLGFVAVLGKSFKVDFNIQRVDVPILVGSAFLLGLMLWDLQFSRMDALVSLIGMVIYIAYILNSDTLPVSELPDDNREYGLKSLKWTTFAILILSAVFIYLGAKYNVESIIKLSGIMNIGKEVIALTAVALGTSLPELVVSIVAARKGNHEMVVGNVLGSNIFNTFAVMGIPGILGKLTIPPDIIKFSLPFMVLSTLMYIFITQDKEVNRWEGMLLLLFYGFFITQIIFQVI